MTSRFSMATWSDAFRSGALCGAGYAALAGAMVLAGLGAVCLATILGSSTAVTAALVLVLVGALGGALLVRRRPHMAAPGDGDPRPEG